MAREIQEDQDMAASGGADGESLSLSFLKDDHFGVIPNNSMLQVCNVFHDFMCKTLGELENDYVRELSNSGSEEAEEQLRFSKRSRVLQQVVKNQLNQLSEWMTAEMASSGWFFTSPDLWLPDDRSYKDYQQEALKFESILADFEKAHEAEVCAAEALLAERKEQEEVEKQLEEILEWVRTLQAAWVKEGNSNLHESFQLVTESVKKLQETLQEPLVQSEAPQ